MKIRRATKDDAQAVQEITQLLNVQRDSQNASGFVEYPIPTIEEYKHLIEGPSFFYIAENAAKIAGFFSAYNHLFLSSIDTTNDAIIQHILKKEKPLIYLEQIAILPEYQQNGIAAQLFRHFFQEIKNKNDDLKRTKQTIWTAISHAPFHNEPSIALSRKYHFMQKEEITVYNGLTFGIYAIK